jgi:hypothetical protein
MTTTTTMSITQLILRTQQRRQTSNNNNNNKKEQQANKEQQVILTAAAMSPTKVFVVPTHGDLVLNGIVKPHVAPKGPCFIEQSSPLKVTVANRDTLATRIFAEAGKARLLRYTNQPILLAK